MFMFGESRVGQANASRLTASAFIKFFKR
jgi:hypothetical protein